MPKLTMEDGTELSYRPLVTIKCMFCGKQASMVEFEDGSMGVVHDVPYCAEFTVMDPLTFIQENRKRMEKDIAEGKFDPN